MGKSELLRSGGVEKRGEEPGSLKVSPFWPESRRRRGKVNLGKEGRKQKKCTFSAERLCLPLFMLMFFMEIRVMRSFSPLAVEQLGEEGCLG